MNHKDFNQEKIKMLVLCAIGLDHIEFLRTMLDNASDMQQTDKLISFVTIYSVIFSNNFNLGKIPDSILKNILTEEEAELHQSIISLRNKEFSHWDANETKKHLDILWSSENNCPYTNIGFYRYFASISKYNQTLCNLLIKLEIELKKLQGPMLKSIGTKDEFEKYYFSVESDKDGTFTIAKCEKNKA